MSEPQWKRPFYANDRSSGQPNEHGWEVRDAAGRSVTGWGNVTQTAKTAHLIVDALNAYKPKRKRSS